MNTIRASLLAVAILSGACSSAGRNAETSTGSPATSTSTSPITLSCNTISAATIESILSITVTGPVVRSTGASTACSYSSGRFRAAVVINIEASATPASFESSAAKLGAYGATTTTISGLGDEAAAASIGSGPDQTNTLTVLSGTTVVTVTAASPIARLQALVNEILSRI